MPRAPVVVAAVFDADCWFDLNLFYQMMKRLMELKKEKEDLALEVEREEELLTNTLQKKLNQVLLRCCGYEHAVSFCRKCVFFICPAPQDGDPCRDS